jgi:hypothetical protein
MPAKQAAPLTAFRRRCTAPAERRDIMRKRVLGAVAAAPLLLALALAGCAKDTKGNGVASAGGPTGASAAPTPSSTLSPQERALKFAACMRENGVPMEDPEIDGEGHVNIKIGGPGQAIDRTKMEAAQEKCKQYSPFGDGLSNGRPDPQMEENARKMAQCMRDNGVENFPDPDGGRVSIDGSIAEDPDFDKAQKACEKLMPGMRKSS